MRPLFFASLLLFHLLPCSVSLAAFEFEGAISSSFASDKIFCSSFECDDVVMPKFGREPGAGIGLWRIIMSLIDLIAAVSFVSGVVSDLGMRERRQGIDAYYKVSDIR